MSDGIYLVTGALGGLGQGVTRALLETGARVAALERRGDAFDAYREALGEELAARLECVQVDVTDEESVAAAFARYADQPVLGVAHLVGGYTGGVSIEATPLADFERMVALNLRSTFLVIRGAAQLLKERGESAAIVCVGSVTGRSGGKHHGPYASTKAAVHSLVRSAAADLAESGVRVNAVLPAMIATPANFDAMPDADHSAWVTPEEVGAAIQWLLSPASARVTGACVEVAGKSYTPD